MPMFVGTSGWQYDDWRGGLYPPGVAKKRWLERYAECFATTENNSAFYYPVGRKTFEGWRARTPDDFVMAVKAGRELTHKRRLKEPAELVAGMVEAARGLGDKLGPMLLQLPPSFRADAGRLDECLACFPKGVRVAVEPRHESWWSDRVRGVLEKHDAALCWADRQDKPVTPLWRTAGWGFLRFHEGTAEPWPIYDEGVLATWLEALGEPGGDVFVYFNNDPGGAAVRNAVQFARRAEAAGWEVTRTPAEFPEELLQPASREWNTPW
ncbi:DUF72 domain-containing protein [Actinomadura macrotermitis]|uniref:DUF72 domain-containing protein n=1 Tax=Actinomadura macrotermitis TaxID=2585200 RepID=A0A7K0BN59_9ACTN|nr:DUF72 domain-containing protein [Actinomadura macrotermitis]MQY02619.1 hypothetical protein [Actinomadura macrotermitis]